MSGKPSFRVGLVQMSMSARPEDNVAKAASKVAEAARLPHYRIADGLPWGANARRAPLEVPAAPAGIPCPHGTRGERRHE